MSSYLVIAQKPGPSASGMPVDRIVGTQPCVLRPRDGHQRTNWWRSRSTAGALSMRSTVVIPAHPQIGARPSRPCGGTAHAAMPGRVPSTPAAGRSRTGRATLLHPLPTVEPDDVHGPCSRSRRARHHPLRGGRRRDLGPAAPPPPAAAGRGGHHRRPRCRGVGMEHLRAAEVVADRPPRASRCARHHAAACCATRRANRR